MNDCRSSEIFEFLLNVGLQLGIQAIRCQRALVGAARVLNTTNQ